jgi:long-chain acyl-CoA synthetase
VRRGLDGLGQLNAWLTRRRPSHALSSALLLPLHQALGGRLRRIFAGGAFVPRATARWLHDQGFPVAIGYGLTEACAVVTVNDLAPFRDDTVGLPLAGTEVRIDAAPGEGSGEVLVRGPQLFAGYLDDPELTASVLGRDGWLRTGDVGRLDPAGHLQLVGRTKHMIVTAGGKNVYPEDVESRFDGLPVEEHAVVAAHAVWPSRPGEDEALVLVVRAGAVDALGEADRRNRALPEHQRVAGVVELDQPFPRTTSLKLRRDALAKELGARRARRDVRPLRRDP